MEERFKIVFRDMVFAGVSMNKGSRPFSTTEKDRLQKGRKMIICWNNPDSVPE
jgi:hypothetical protein